jgi:periplasmic protein TonB
MTVAVSAIAHVVTIGGLAFVPLLQTQALTIPPIDTSLVLPRTERPQSVQVFPVLRRFQVHSDSTIPVLTVPTSVPNQIAYVDEPPKPDFGFVHSTIGAIGLLDGREHSLEIAAPVIAPPSPPPPPPLPIVNASPLRRGGNVQAANLIYEVKPIYPALAKITHTQGVVVLEAVINKDGSIESLHVVSGHQLLTQAAVDAVRQWKYRPTVLNGEAVDVLTTVTVTFTLQ